MERDMANIETLPWSFRVLVVFIAILLLEMDIISTETTSFP
jgi:hypothetical protein